MDSELEADPESFSIGGIFKPYFYNCNSKLWETFTPDRASAISFGSDRDFGAFGMSIFCSEVQTGIFEFKDFSSWVGVSSSEDKDCKKNDEVEDLQKDIEEIYKEYSFWYNFNDWMTMVHRYY